MRRMTQLCSALAASAMIAASAHAAPVVIYQDDFNGTSADLNGTTPDIGTGNWLAPPRFNADGSVTTTTPTTTTGNATLAFTPADGLVYTLDASLSGVSSTGGVGWFALGFGSGTGSSSGTVDNRFVTGASIGKAWMLFLNTTTVNNNQTFLGNATSGTQNMAFWSTDFANGGDIDLRIVLDTTGGSGNYTATFFAKRPTSGTYTEVRSETGLANETISLVGVAVSGPGMNGTIESFSLTSVPEPGSLALLGLGGLLIARRRRG